MKKKITPRITRKAFQRLVCDYYHSIGNVDHDLDKWVWDQVKAASRVLDALYWITLTPRMEDGELIVEAQDHAADGAPRTMSKRKIAEQLIECEEATNIGSVDNAFIRALASDDAGEMVSMHMACRCIAGKLLQQLDYTDEEIKAIHAKYRKKYFAA